MAINPDRNLFRPFGVIEGRTIVKVLFQADVLGAGPGVVISFDDGSSMSVWADLEQKSVGLLLHMEKGDLEGHLLAPVDEEPTN